MIMKKDIYYDEKFIVQQLVELLNKRIEQLEQTEEDKNN